METLCFRFASLLVITVLLPLLALSAAYTLPEKFYINCGSDSNVTYGNRIFVGDMISNTNSVSFSSRGSEVNNQSGSSTTPGIYRSVRIFRRSSSYKFRIDPLGLHFVRLHFSAVSRELSTASFTVSAKPHFESFSLRNFNETPRVEEFLLMIDKPEFEIRFEPSPSSVAFVNAIEVFFAPNNTIPSNASDKLRTVYRLNVGGKKITPENDTLGRTWLLDDDFLYGKDSAKNIQSTQKPNYEGGSVSATDYTAPDFVYQTAKTMRRRSMKGAERQVLMNLTWSFKVKTKTRYFIRFHFCDILSNSQSSDNDFYLYVNGQWREDVQPSTMSRLVTPFYKDVVNISDGSGLLNVSIRNKVAETDAAFLNGLEVMEFLKISSGPDSSSSYRVHIIAGCVAAAFVLALCLLFVVFLKRRSNKKKKKTTPDAEVSVWSALPLQKGGSSDHTSSYPVNNSPLRNLHLGLKIPLSDILSATNNFDEQWLIGRGGFGDVYKSTLPNGSKAAIKRGKTSSGQGILEFQTEIQVLSRIRHRHLVSLTGYCEENSEMILVYEFMEKGTLREHLYGSDLPPLTWKQRIEICIGAAGGLRYLHEEAIIHRDVKSTNILLDENNVAKVADFGLSKLAANRDQSNISTNIKGTFGYLDPEYLQTHLLTEKSDVFAFGVVLLEVLCARPALDTTVPHEEEVNLAEWFMFCKSKGVTNEIIDPKLMGQIEPSSLRKFMETAEKCLKEYGEERPSMADVKWDLEYALQLQVMTTQREPHEDSAVTISGGSSLVIPRLMVNDSFSSNSFVPRNEVKSSHGGTTTDSSESRVFSQLNMSEAR